VRDEVIYRCVNHSCARALPRKVNYCPYCGIDQATAAPRPVPPRAAPAWQAETFAPEAIVTAAPEATAHPAPPGPGSSSPPPDAAQPFTPRPGVTATITGKTAPAGPPQRRPVQLRWIALVLIVLWLAYAMQRPGSNARPSRLDTRIDKAVAMALACKANEAQAELIAMKEKASTVQLARLQAALDEADLSCRKGRVRSGARSGTGSSQSVRNLLADGRSAFARGDYRAAADKMEVCVTMVDADTKECAALKARAERLEGEQRRCLARGREWVGDSCQ
jgi:hypothetical protein